MKLEFAFLADAATMLENGTFDVIAGGFDVVKGKTFPATKYAMTLVGRLRFDPEEIGKQYEFVAEIIDQEGKSIFQALRGTFTPLPHPRYTKRANWFSLCFSWQGVPFPAPGDYFIRLSVDGEPVGEVMIEAVQEEK